MSEKIHYRFDRYEGKSEVVPRYLCNWAVAGDVNRMVFEKDKVTCKNCLNILKNFPMNREGLN